MNMKKLLSPAAIFIIIALLNLVGYLLQGTSVFMFNCGVCLVIAGYFRFSKKREKKAYEDSMKEQE